MAAGSSGGLVESECVAVEPARAEEARRVLSSRGLLRRGLKAGRSGGRVLFPVVNARAAVEALSSAGVPAEECRGAFEERRVGLGSPREAGLPGYWLVGDLIVFNPREGVGIEEYRRYARLLVERGAARGVFLKAGTHGPYRLPRLIHLAGEESTVTVAKEHGLRFLVDIARVYYNPRLAMEHARVASQVRDGERVLDMFTGAGGFAVHIAARAEALVLAVDWNPHAAYYAAWNACWNRLRGRVSVLRADAALLPQLLEPAFNRVVMNNPTASLEYAPQACRLIGGRGAVHVYTLASGPREAVDAAVGAFEAAGCRASAGAVREVLEHSPREGIYAVDLDVERRGASAGG